MQIEKKSKAGLDGIAAQTPHKQIARLLELPQLRPLEGVRRQREAPAAQDLHHQEGEDDLDVLRQRVRRELQVAGAEPGEVGGDKRGFCPFGQFGVVRGLLGDAMGLHPR